MDIEDVYVQRILIFIHISENYRLLNVVIFEKWEYMFYMGCIIYPANSSHNFQVNTLFYRMLVSKLKICIYAKNFDFL
jgi:hypothetical protein